jgi:hypothetical protein
VTQIKLKPVARCLGRCGFWHACIFGGACACAQVECPFGQTSETRLSLQLPKDSVREVLEVARAALDMLGARKQKLIAKAAQEGTQWVPGGSHPWWHPAMSGGGLDDVCLTSRRTDATDLTHVARKRRLHEMYAMREAIASQAQSVDAISSLVVQAGECDTVSVPVGRLDVPRGSSLQNLGK